MAGDSEKTTPWWNQEVKEAFRAKKNAFKALLQDRSSSDLQSRYTEARKAATLAVKKSKEKSREEFGHRLNSNYFSAHKVFRQISAVFVTKDRVSRTPSRIPQVCVRVNGEQSKPFLVAVCRANERVGQGGTMTPGPMDFRGPMGFREAHHGASWLQGAHKRAHEMTMRNQDVEDGRHFFF